MGIKTEKTVIKGLGFCANGNDANISEIDISGDKIVRIRPLHFDKHYSPEHYKPWKIEARGKVFQPSTKSLIPPFSLGYKKRIYSSDRVLYPLKRVDWDHTGNRNTHNRGKSKYIRISWGEALEIITSELKRIKKEYGPYAIFSQSDGHGETKVVHASHGCHRRLLELFGGYTLQTRNPNSWEGYYWGAKHVWGMESIGMQYQSNMISDIANNTEMLLFWGCDAGTTGWGWGGQLASRLMFWFKELGIKCIFICPDLNYSAGVTAHKWIPIKPNTDAALQLAIAYIWITSRAYDEEYVATHTFGFDKFEEYVLGKEDRIPKTPEWASNITGIEPCTIKALANIWSLKRTTVVHGNGGPYIRGSYSTEPARLEILLLAMQGLGKPGANQARLCEFGFMGKKDEMNMPRGVVIPNLKAAYRGSSANAIPKQIIPKTMVHEAILNPPISWYGTTLLNEPVENQFKKYTYPVDDCPEIHMIWSDSPCWMTCWNGGNRLVEAFRSPKIEFVLCQHPWMENDCLLADIILPVSTKFEENDIGADCQNGQYNIVQYEEKCIQPLGESKSDYEIVCMIAEKLGLLNEYTDGKSIDDYIKIGFQESGIRDMITYEEFTKKGYYIVPTDPEWPEYETSMADFYRNPDEHPLRTPSGRIEFYSQNLAKYFPGDNERPPVPHWIPYGDSHQESLLHPRANKYPFLLVSNHPRWRVSAQHDDNTWLREIPTCKVKGPDGYRYEPVWINPVDATSRKIENGDIIKIFNERGIVLGGAIVTERIMPGVVYQDHGAKYDPIVPGYFDRGGANNTIAPYKTTSRNVAGMITSGFLVGIEKADLRDLAKQYPEPF